MSESYLCITEQSLRELAAQRARHWTPGTLVLLSGPLGAGKTTFVRGVLESLGFHDSVRSPTFNLMNVYETQPPILHADLYRLESAENLGLEEYFHDHLCMIEWPDRLSRKQLHQQWIVEIEIDFHPEGRRITISEPTKTDRK